MRKNEPPPCPRLPTGGEITVIHRETAILARLDELAAELTAAYDGEEIHALVILHGSLIFAADLLRRIPLPMRIDTLNVSSYHGAKESSGAVTFHQASLPHLSGRHVLLLDDILDTGRTLHAIVRRIREESSPASFRICVLLQKRKQRACEIVADSVGFEMDDEFVIGYGLDYQGHYRNLPYIASLTESAMP